MKTVCHCKIKENAELIGRILDCDAEGAIFVYEAENPFKQLHSYVTEIREEFQQEKDSYLQTWRNEEDSDKRFRLNMAIGVQKRILDRLDDILFYLETGEPPYDDCSKIPHPTEKGGVDNDEK